MWTSFQRTNNNNTLPLVTTLYQASYCSSYFTMERAAKTLHRMSPCTPVSVPAKITWNICNIMKTFQFNEYPATLPKRFYCRTCPWLHEQHSGFTNPSTSERTVVLPLQVKICLTCSCGLNNLGSAMWYNFERIFTRTIFVLTICYVTRACLGKAVKKSLAWIELNHF